MQAQNRSPGEYQPPDTSEGQDPASAIVSVPHSGTHALIHHFGWEGRRNQARGSTPDTPFIVGHVWGWDGPKDELPHAEDWVEMVAGRTAWMPVRDPEQLARSWPIVHGRPLEKLFLTLTEACKLLTWAPHIRKVDIRTLKPIHVQSQGQRDTKTGAELLERFPEYFGEHYGRKTRKLG